MSSGKDDFQIPKSAELVGNLIQRSEPTEDVEYSNMKTEKIPMPSTESQLITALEHVSRDLDKEDRVEVSKKLHESLDKKLAFDYKSTIFNTGSRVIMWIIMLLISILGGPPVASKLWDIYTHSHGG